MSAIPRPRRAERHARRGGVESVLLRRLPGDTPMHRLGVETKLLGLLVLTIATGLDTGWPMLIAVGAVVAMVMLVARVPWRAFPRLPLWFPVSLLVGLALASAGGGGGRFARLMAFSLLFTVLSLLIAWTTELHELAPALRRLGAPLRRLGAPLDEWALTAALAVRCLPLILDECRTVLAGRRQRQLVRNPEELIDAVIDVISSSMSASVRRAADLGEAIAMRGGPAPPPARPARRRVRDAVALLVVLGASVLPLVLAH
jgi:energy-coupling factor transport system permease protein